MAAHAAQCLVFLVFASASLLVFEGGQPAQHHLHVEPEVDDSCKVAWCQLVPLVLLETYVAADVAVAAGVEVDFQKAT